jgi:GTP-binding protein
MTRFADELADEGEDEDIEYVDEGDIEDIEDYEDFEYEEEV